MMLDVFFCSFRPHFFFKPVHIKASVCCSSVIDIQTYDTYLKTTKQINRKIGLLVRHSASNTRKRSLIVIFPFQHVEIFPSVIPVKCVTLFYFETFQQDIPKSHSDTEVTSQCGYLVHSNYIMNTIHAHCFVLF